jgi:hypothetical protein|tara:strand:- start:289 stop:486 length:198 start_codon:yes stop_codon:yes gene_type:complete
MDDFNKPGSNKIGITPEVENFVTQLQLDNVCKILGGELKHYFCSDKTTTHEKIVIEYNHKKKCKQ